MVTQPHADIIFMPYNYLIDPMIRDKFDINFADSLMIIDEGHNVEQVSEEAMSFELSVDDFIQCIEEVKQLEKAKK